MITKMKKLTFLIYHKDYECFLQNIRDLGVVHVAVKAQGTAENTDRKRGVKGKSVAVRVDLGGRRIIKKMQRL